MHVTIEKIGSIAVIEIADDILDASNAKEFKQNMLSIIEEESLVVFDLHSLQFIDSSGLGAILSCLRNLHSRNGDMRLCHISKPVRALFELVRMHRIFDIYNTREEAMASFNQ